MLTTYYIVLIALIMLITYYIVLIALIVLTTYIILTALIMLTISLSLIHIPFEKSDGCIIEHLQTEPSANVDEKVVDKPHRSKHKERSAVK